MMNIFHEVSQECSKITTERYSTSFTSAIRLLHAICVRLFIIFMDLSVLQMKSWILSMIMKKMSC